MTRRAAVVLLVLLCFGCATNSARLYDPQGSLVAVLVSHPFLRRTAVDATARDPRTGVEVHLCSVHESVSGNATLVGGVLGFVVGSIFAPGIGSAIGAIVGGGGGALVDVIVSKIHQAPDVVPSCMKSKDAVPLAPHLLPSGPVPASR